MSGAMTFAALMAAEAELGLVDGDVAALMALAHAAEVGFSTGLGDVVAQAEGGLDVRVRQGLPPSGEVLVHREERDILVAWSGEPLHTRTIIDDPDARRRLRSACEHRLDNLPDGPTLDWLLDEGWGFAKEAGLAGEAVEEMVDLCARHGKASQVMLGNSVFATGDLEAMAIDLEEAGYRFRLTSIDNRGVRVLDQSRWKAFRPP